MANQRDIKKRIGSIESTRTITRTMEMVATAKVRPASERVTKATPFSEAMNSVLGDISKYSSNINHPLLREHESKKNAIAIVVVSDGGLAGGFNSNILRTVDTYIEENRQKGIVTNLIICGKKGIGYYKYRDFNPIMSFDELSADPTMEQTRQISGYARTAFEKDEADEVKIFYNHARNAADQDLRVETVFPIDNEMLSADTGIEHTGSKGDATQDMSSPDFEPDTESVLESLLPAYAETKIYHALIDSAAAEQGARRKAMKSATDNADELIETLNRLYNRVRQGAITTEITEIVGGAAALEE